MQRVSTPHDPSTVTYDLDDGRVACFDRHTVERYGVAALMAAEGIKTPTGRLPVMRNGRRIGTLPAAFDPEFARSTSFLYDVRPGDLVREGEAWIVGLNMGACDIDCVAGFVRE